MNVRRPRERDRGAGIEEIEAVYRCRFHDFHRLATALLGDGDAAYDAVQEAFASAVRERERFRREAPLEAWLWRIVVDAAHRARVPRREAAAGDVPTSSNGSRREDLEMIRSAVARLPERQRLAVFLRYYADFDYAAIAQLLDVEVGTVSSTLSAGHERLRQLLKEDQTT